MTNPTILCPEHGPPIARDCAAALRETAQVLSAVAALKSFEEFSKVRVGDPPSYPFLAKEQVSTAGDAPWSRLSPHLYLSGNTYVLASKNGALLVLDAYGPRIVEQLRKLQADEKLGAVELVLISHAHNDHFKGIFLLPDRATFKVGTIRDVAFELENPYYFCAPYLDARPLVIDREFRDGEVVRWREYELKIHHLPGQTEFAMGVETTIDGKKCFFTADNFYHADQFTGSGGWSGRNRGLPLGYAKSAQKVIDADPAWVLAEHGGAMGYSREDFQRRVRWARAAAEAADLLSPSGNHHYDWDPYRVHVEPMLQAIPRGHATSAYLVVTNPGKKVDTLDISVAGRGLVTDCALSLTVKPGGREQRELAVSVLPGAAAGRHVFPLVVRRGEVEDGSDAFFVVDVQQ
jgi:glyoxylase-like metal-dependent hydrolase (beta-lactamase superfamily II)